MKLSELVRRIAGYGDHVYSNEYYQDLYFTNVENSKQIRLTLVNYDRDIAYADFDEDETVVFENNWIVINDVQGKEHRLKVFLLKRLDFIEEGII